MGLPMIKPRNSQKMMKQGVLIVTEPPEPPIKTSASVPLSKFQLFKLFCKRVVNKQTVTLLMGSGSVVTGTLLFKGILTVGLFGAAGASGGIALIAVGAFVLGLAIMRWCQHPKIQHVLPSNPHQVSNEGAVTQINEPFDEDFMSEDEISIEHNPKTYCFKIVTKSETLHYNSYKGEWYDENGKLIEPPHNEEDIRDRITIKFGRGI
jgi:hypothetical protein